MPWIESRHPTTLRAPRTTDPRPPPPVCEGTPVEPLLRALAAAPVTLAALCARTGLDTGSLLARLLALELEGSVASLPGGLYQRIARA